MNRTIALRALACLVVALSGTRAMAQAVGANESPSTLPTLLRPFDRGTWTLDLTGDYVMDAPMDRED